MRMQSKRALTCLAMISALSIAVGGAAYAHPEPESDGAIDNTDKHRDAHQHGDTKGHLPASQSDNIDLVSKLQLKNAKWMVTGDAHTRRCQPGHGSQEFSNLPRKFKTAISGHPSHDVVPQVNDVSFIGVVHPVHGPGFDLLVGGGLSTNPMLAQRLGTWVPLAEVPEVWKGVVSVFRDYGYRRLRARARLKFLVADWGAARFRQVLEQEYLGRQLLDGPEAPAPRTPADHIGVHSQNDGRFYVGVSPMVGRVTGAYD